jgi:integrase
MEMHTMSKLSLLGNEFLDYRKAMGFCNNPHELYLRKFIEYSSMCFPDSNTLSKAAAIGWLDSEASRKRSNITMKSVLLRRFGKYLSAVGVDAYILPDGHAPFKSDFTPYLLNDVELTAFMKVIDGIASRRYTGYGRDPYAEKVLPVLIRLLYTCGLRPSEGRLLKRSSIDFATGEIHITETKRHRDRVVVMSDDMLSLCRKYDAWRTTTLTSSEYFFMRSDNMPFNAGWLVNTVYQCWQWSNPDLPRGKIPRLRPYDFRHLFASKILQKWIDEKRDLYAMLPYLRTYMGHIKFRDTAYYIHILPESLLGSPGVNWSGLDKLMPEAELWVN